MIAWHRNPLLTRAAALCLVLWAGAIAQGAAARADGVPLAPPTAYRLVAPLGVAGEPYPASSLQNDPRGLAADPAEGLWIAEGAGRRVQYLAATGPVAEIGRPGRGDGIAGVALVGNLADVDVVRAPVGPFGWTATPTASPTWPATNTPIASPSATYTASPSPTPTPTATATNTAQATATREPSATATQGPSPTPRPTATTDPLAARPEALRLVWYADSQAHAVVGLWLVPGREPARVVATLGEPGVPGDDPGHLRAPEGVAADPRGYVYISDTGNHRILVVRWDGTRAAVLGAGRPSAADTAFDTPKRLAFDGEDQVLHVADAGNHRVVSWSMADPANPALLRVIGRTGAPGDGPDQLDSPSGIAVAGDLLFVADTGNDRVQVLSADTGRARTSIASSAPSDVAVTVAGELAIAEPAGHVVRRLDARTLGELGGWGTAGVPHPADATYVDGPIAAAPAPGGGWLVAARGGGVWHHAADGTVDMLRPRRAARGTVALSARADGWSAVLDAEPPALTLFDPDGDEAASWPVPPADPGGAVLPAGMALLGIDRVLVADAAALRARLLGLDGLPAADLDGTALAAWRFAAPGAVARAGDGRIAIADAGRSTVEVFAASGAHLRTLGRPDAPGPAFDAFDRPGGVAFAPDGRLAVVDAGNHRVQVFDDAYRYLATLGGVADLEPSGMRAPAGAAFDAAGTLAVADAEAHRVLRFAPADDPSWRPEATNGFGAPSSGAVSALLVLDGVLTAAVADRAEGAALWQTEDGQAWEEVMAGGFGDTANAVIPVLAAHGGWVYAGTESVVARERGRPAHSRGAGLWRSRDGERWEPVTTDGFGDAARHAVTALFSTGDALFAALGGATSAVAASVWRSATGDPGTWAPVGAAGLGDPANRAVSAMAVFSDTLHAGTCHASGSPQVWRLDPDADAWLPAGAFVAPEGGVQRPAIGDGPNRDCVAALEPFDGGLYALIAQPPALAGWWAGAEGIELWRCCQAEGPWVQAAAPGFGVPGARGAGLLGSFDSPPFRFLYAAVGGREGLTVHRSLDGALWEPVGDVGLGDDRNGAVGGAAARAVFRDRLWLGTSNAAHGGELWSTSGSRPPAPGPTAAAPATATPRPRPVPPDGPLGYHRVDQWPVAALDQPSDVLGNILDLAVDGDGTAFLADDLLSRVAVRAADGRWLPPLAVAGPPSIRLGRAGPIAVDGDADRLYVGDLASDRIVVMDRAGALLGELGGVHPADLAVDAAGELWVADRLSGGLRRFARDGTEVWSYGRYGLPRRAQQDRDIPDRFAGLTGIGVDGAGRVYVAHRGGQILRTYRREGDALVLERSADLGRVGCGAQHLVVMGPGRVAVEKTTNPASACTFTDGVRDRDLPLAHGGYDVDQVVLRATDPNLRHAVAIGRWITAPGAAAAAIARPAVLAYVDAEFRALRRLDRGRAFGALMTDPAQALVQPVRISSLDDGTLVVSDAAGGVRRFTPTGGLVEQLPLTTHPSSAIRGFLEPALTVSAGEPGHVIGIGATGRGPSLLPGVLYGGTLQRRRCVAGNCSFDAYVDPIWRTSLPSNTYPDGLNALAVDFAPGPREFLALQLYRDNPSLIEDLPARVLRYGLDRGGRRREFPLEWGDRLALWVDLDVGSDGRVYVLDTLNDRVEIKDIEGNTLATVRPPQDAWRVAGGPGGDVFVLTTHAEVVRVAPDGTERARFKGLPREGLPDLAVVDLEVDGDGWVYVLDGLERRVTVFAPEGRDDRVDVGAACSFAGDKWAVPTDLDLGEETTLELLLAGTCGYVEEPADIVVAVAIYPRSPGRRPDPTMQNLRVARQIVSAIDFTRHRMGILVYSSVGNVEVAVTDRLPQLIRSITSVKPASQGAGNDYVALRMARDLFAGSGARKKVLILLAPFNNDSDPAWDAADDLAASGVTIVTVNDGGASPYVTSELMSGVPVAPFGAGTARPALRWLFRRQRPPSLVATGILTDRLPANMAYVPGSAQPPATWDAAARTLAWDLAGWPEGAAFRASVRVRPLAVGEWPTNAEAAASLVDGWGRPARVDLPVPRVRVYGEAPPTATLRPTRTPTPTPTRLTTATASPTATREPVPVYLPLALRPLPCTPATRRVEVALVLDTSGSMSERTSPGGPTKLEAAHSAARAFLEQLLPAQDRAALIQFNETVEVLAPLGPPAEAALALARLSQAPGTRLDLALDAVAVELDRSRRRPGSDAVAILLTDGEPTGTTAADVRAAAARLRASGVLVFTIGLGTAVDGALLADVASRPAWYFQAPDTDDLARIYAQIAYEIPCAPEWP